MEVELQLAYGDVLKLFRTFIPLHDQGCSTVPRERNSSKGNEFLETAFVVS